MLNFGILGLNYRNLYYIKKFNPNKAIRLADNKFATKTFLQQRGIPVAKTLGLINDRKSLYRFDFSTFDNIDFIVKPNKGSKGKGVYIIKKLDKNSKQIREYESKLGIEKIVNLIENNNTKDYYNVSGEIMDEITFKKYLIDILDGKYSISSFSNDKILIEEKLLPGSGFSRYCKYGLADIRVIVFNLIPVASMVRVPSIVSKGRGNINAGGVGLGVEVGSGKIKSMLYKGQIFDDKFHGEFSDFYNKKLPFWNDILLLSSKIQYFVNLGFLALDWVITENGPKLLEINARAGLEIQNASILQLRNRLDKISDIKVEDPEKGVEIAKSLFTKSKGDLIVNSKVLYLSQRGKLVLEGKESDIFENIIIKINLNSDKNFVSKYLYDKISSFKDGDYILDIYESDIRIKNFAYNSSIELGKFDILLGKTQIESYYIKPIEKIYDQVNILKKGSYLENEIESLHMIDLKISKISRQINLINGIKPINYLNELDNFITWHGNYNPKFIYNFIPDQKITSLLSQISFIEDNYFNKNFGLKSDILALFYDKLNEIKLRLGLINSYKNNNYDNIYEYNELLFESIDMNLVKSSKELVLDSYENYDYLLGDILSFSQIKKIIKKYLQDRGINGVKILLDSSSFSRISIVRGKKLMIKISENSQIRENEIYSILSHEIDVHLMRYLNGVKTGWEIFSQGTSKYFIDEEGLAVYNSQKTLPNGIFRKSIYLKYYLIHLAQLFDFAKLAEQIRAIKGVGLMESFKTASRIKRGIQNTGFIGKGAVFYKDKIYLDGFIKIDNWIKQGGVFEKLLVGKIKIQDLKYLETKK